MNSWWGGSRSFRAKAPYLVNVISYSGTLCRHLAVQVREFLFSTSRDVTANARPDRQVFSKEHYGHGTHPRSPAVPPDDHCKRQPSCRALAVLMLTSVTTAVPLVLWSPVPVSVDGSTTAVYSLKVPGRSVSSHRMETVSELECQ